MYTEFIEFVGAGMIFFTVLVLIVSLSFCFKKYSDKFKEKSLEAAIATFVCIFASISTGFSAGVEFSILFGLILFNLGILVFIIFRVLKLEIVIR